MEITAVSIGPVDHRCDSEAMESHRIESNLKKDQCMERDSQRQAFLQTHLAKATVTALPGDASFRRYYRLQDVDKPYLLMDAPPALEDSHGFVAIGTCFRQHGILTPQIYAQDLEHGFLLLEDFGDALLSAHLTQANSTALYQACFEPLLRIQTIQSIPDWSLPRFDQALALKELQHCQEWFLTKFLGLSLDEPLQHCLHTTFERLLTDIRTHPQVCVHRDYHSRNLMLLPQQAIGVLDFQDAVIGSIVYDLVSLLRDCYVSWPIERVHAWLADFYEALPGKANFSLAQFQQWFDYQGLQRHLKCLFIFARKWLRDGSVTYLPDLVTTFNYIETVASHYPAFKALNAYLPDWRHLMLERITSVSKGS